MNEPNEMEILRARLNDEIEKQDGNLLSSRVLELSQEFDELMLLEMKRDICKKSDKKNLKLI